LAREEHGVPFLLLLLLLFSQVIPMDTFQETSVMDELSRAPESYEEALRSFKIPRPAYFNFTTDVFDEYARKQPSELAMIWAPDPRSDEKLRGGIGRQREDITYTQMSQAAHAAAAAFIRLGIKKGDRVMVMLPRIPGMLESEL
jgi:non-ribosomal peptide synthetase component E (peptide arylation enzyme)